MYVDTIKCKCQKILPLVYDDSISYYEAICKFQSKLNELIEATNDFFTTNITQAIDNYFNSIMFDAIYDESTETITLKKEVISGDGRHLYDSATNTMIIESEDK